MVACLFGFMIGRCILDGWFTCPWVVYFVLVSVVVFALSLVVLADC